MNSVCGLMCSALFLIMSATFVHAEADALHRTARAT